MAGNVAVPIRPWLDQIGVKTISCSREHWDSVGASMYIDVSMANLVKNIDTSVVLPEVPCLKEDLVP
jgi:hypothetical protein